MELLCHNANPSTLIELFGVRCLYVNEALTLEQLKQKIVGEFKFIDITSKDFEFYSYLIL